jgi:hypothetical protein
LVSELLRSHKPQTLRAIFSATTTHILHPKLLHLLYDRLLIFVKKGKGYKPYTEGKFPDLFPKQKLNFFKVRASFEKVPGQ